MALPLKTGKQEVGSPLCTSRVKTGALGAVLEPVPALSQLLITRRLLQNPAWWEGLQPTLTAVEAFPWECPARGAVLPFSLLFPDSISICHGRNFLKHRGTHGKREGLVCCVRRSPEQLPEAARWDGALGIHHKLPALLLMLSQSPGMAPNPCQAQEGQFQAGASWWMSTETVPVLPTLGQPQPSGCTATSLDPILDGIDLQRSTGPAQTPLDSGTQHWECWGCQSPAPYPDPRSTPRPQIHIQNPDPHSDPSSTLRSQLSTLIPAPYRDSSSISRFQPQIHT